MFTNMTGNVLSVRKGLSHATIKSYQLTALGFEDSPESGRSMSVIYEWHDRLEVEKYNNL
jgi:hypothetical protein